MKKKEKNIRIIVGAIVLVLVLFFASYIDFAGGKGAYKLSLTRGVSKNIEESKERGVYQFDLEYEIQPDSIFFESPPDFYLEKGFRYGEWRASDTEPLSDTSKPYQIVFKNSSKLFNYDFFIEDYYDKQIWRLGSIDIDTIKFNLMSKSPPYDSIQKVGEIKLFRKK